MGARDLLVLYGGSTVEISLKNEHRKRPTVLVGLFFFAVVDFLAGLDALPEQSVRENPRYW